MPDTAVFDVDGTLVDTNYQHALSWYRSFRYHGLTFPLWQIHRHIGMGGDQMVKALAGEDVERDLGEDLRARWTEEFEPMMGEIAPFAGARELLVEVTRRGFRLVLASSGQQAQVEHYLDLLDARDLADDWTTSDDVEQTKPAPDLVQVAVGKVEGASAVMIGDCTFDVIAAGKLDVPTLGVLTGGFSAEELTEAGAVAVYSSVGQLCEDLDDTPLARPS